MAKTKENTLSKAKPVMSTLDFGIFQGKILFTCGFTLKEAKEELLKQDCKDWVRGMSNFHDLANAEGYACHRVIKVEGNMVHYYYMHLKQFDFNNDYHYCTLAHEVLHLCQMVLKDILERDREFECEAYLHTYIMGKALKVLRGELL